MKTTEYTETSGSHESFTSKEIGLAENSEPRCACIILADRSVSMIGEPISEVNAGLEHLKSSLMADPLACLRVELALLSFNTSTTIEVDFCSPENFNPRPLTASGGTKLGAAVIKCLEMLDARRAEYLAAGISFYRPWLVVLTDGCSADGLSKAARMVKHAETQKKLSFFGIGVQGANMEQLGSLSLRPPLALEGLQFTELFEWLSVNLSSVAVSRPGDQVPLTPPNWATV